MSDHSKRAHAKKLRPSDSHRWIECPGSIRLAADLPDQTSVFAEEGTAAHMLCEAVLTGEIKVDDPLVGRVVKVGETEYECDEEMARAVKLYVSVCDEIAEASTECEVEQRVDLTHIAADMFGTADFVAYNERTGKLTVCDFKYGRGVVVEPQNNPQLLLYALGAVKRFHNRGLRDVELVVVQPRTANGVRRWQTDATSLLEIQVDLIDAAKATEDPDAPLRAGDWCKFCRAAATCPALKAQVDEIARMEFGEPIAPSRLSPAELATTLEKVDLVEDWCRRIREFAHAEALDGRPPLGWKLVQKRGLRKWADERSAEKRLVELGLDVGEIFSRKLISPAQADKILKKQKEAITDLVVKESSGLTLAPESDPRPPAKPEASYEFGADDRD